MAGNEPQFDESAPAPLTVSDAAAAARMLPAIGVEEIDAARRYAEAARTASTRRAYAADWRRFDTWCLARGLDPLPADPRVVAVFLSAEAASGTAPPTIGRRLAAIGWMHRRAGYQPPHAREGDAAITEVFSGIRRSHGTAPVKKHAADADVLRDILRGIPGDDLRSVRDRALLAFGMAGAFRRSELVALRVADVEWVEEGFRVSIRRGKSDQEGAGEGLCLHFPPPTTCINPCLMVSAHPARPLLTSIFRSRPSPSTSPPVAAHPAAAPPRPTRPPTSQPRPPLPPRLRSH